MITFILGFVAGIIFTSVIESISEEREVQEKVGAGNHIQGNFTVVNNRHRSFLVNKGEGISGRV